MLNRPGMLLLADGTIWGAKPVQAADGTAPLEVEPQVDAALYQPIVERAKQQGFDTGKLLKTRPSS